MRRDSRKLGMPGKDLQKDIDRFHKGKISSEELLEKHGHGADGYEIAKMILAGDGFEVDEKKAWQLKVAAAMCGVEEAMWDILSAPKRSGTDALEYFDDKKSVFEQWVEKKTENAIDVHTTVQTIGDDEEKLSLFREKAESDPELCAVLAVAAYHDYQKEEFEKYAPLSPDSYRPEFGYARYRFGFFEYKETRDQGTLDRALDCLRESAKLGYWRAQYELGMFMFTGRFMERDPTKAFDLLILAAESTDNYEPRRLLEYYLDDDSEPISGMEEEEAVHMLRGHGQSRREFNFPDRDLEGCPEWQVLTHITETDYHGCCCMEAHCNECGGYENDLFAINPYYWGDIGDRDYGRMSDRPNFLFKPTGFEIEWYKYPFRDAFMNRKLNEKQLRHMLRLCVESVIEDFARGDVL